ncbi:MAG: hypothetical protein RIC55_19220 [Pirellulaceae bacterium]
MSRVEQELGIHSGDEPARQLVDAAMWAVPAVIEGVAPDLFRPLANATAVNAGTLISQLAAAGHARRPSAWALHELMASSRLGAEIATIRFPDPVERQSENTVVKVGDTDISITDSPALYAVPESTVPGEKLEAELPPGVRTTKAYKEVQYLVIWATDQLWFWWRDLRGALLEMESNERGYLRWPNGRFLISGRNWQLLRCIWGHRKVPFIEVGEAVWEDDLVKPGTVRPQVSRLNDHLARHELDLSWDTHDEHIVLVRGPSGASAE